MEKIFNTSATYNDSHPEPVKGLGVSLRKLRVGLYAASPRAAAGFSLQSLTRATNERENLSFIRNFFAKCPLEIYSAKASYNSADALGLLLISPERQRTDEVNLTRALFSPLNIVL